MKTNLWLLASVAFLLFCNATTALEFIHYDFASNTATTLYSNTTFPGANGFIQLNATTFLFSNLNIYSAQLRGRSFENIEKVVSDFELVRTLGYRPLLLTPGSLIYANNSALWGINLPHGIPTQIIKRDIATYNDLAFDGEYVYWTEFSTELFGHRLVRSNLKTEAEILIEKVPISPMKIAVSKQLPGVMYLTQVDLKNDGIYRFNTKSVQLDKAPVIRASLVGGVVVNSKEELFWTGLSSKYLFKCSKIDACDDTRELLYEFPSTCSSTSNKLHLLDDESGVILVC